MSRFTGMFRSLSKKLKRPLKYAAKLLLNRVFLACLIFILAGNYIYATSINRRLQHAQDHLVTDAFRNQFNQGKACGLLTRVEARNLLGKVVTVEGNIVFPGSPAALKLIGNPYVDTCLYQVLTSSDGYIDIVIKSYSNTADASKAYDKEVPNYLDETNEPVGDLGQKLKYGSGLYYLLRNKTVLQISASYSPRRADAETKQFVLQILQSVVNKL